MVAIRTLPLRVRLTARIVRGLLALAVLLAIAGAPQARAQEVTAAIYGVTALDVAPGAAVQGMALLKQYRESARTQAGNAGVMLLQELDWPNRFVIYEAWQSQAAYDDNEKAAHTAALRDRLKAMNGAYDRRDYSVISVGPMPAAQAAGGDAIYMQLHLDVFPPGLAATLAATKVVAEAARKGEGNLRYDVVGSVKPPLSHTTVLAAWTSRDAFDAYESSAYARRFRDAVGPLLGSPYDDRLYLPVK